MASNAYPVGDAEVTDLEFRRWAGPITGNGVIPTVDNAYEVFGDSSGRQVKVRPGYAFIKGILFPLASQLTVALDAGSGQPRIDALVLRLTASGTPTGDPIVKKGAAAASPSAPALTQTEDGTYEIVLAWVNVPAASSYVVSAGMVIDKRTMLAPPGQPTQIISDGNYVKVGTSGSGDPRLYSNHELVYDVTSAGVALGGTRPMVISPSGTFASLAQPFHKDFIPKDLDTDSVSNTSNRSGGAGTGRIDFIDKVKLASLAATPELANLYVGSDGVIKKSTQTSSPVSGDWRAKITASSGWTCSVATYVRVGRYMDAYLSFIRTGSRIDGNGSGDIENVKLGHINDDDYTPIIVRGMTAGTGGVITSGFIEADGDIYLAALPPNINVSTSDVLSFSVSYIWG